jgi:tetratricopeptide (TPR) repeat protein
VLRSSRGQAYAALGRWKEATADFRKALEVEADIRVAGWRTLCLAGAGDWAAHRQVCDNLLGRLGTKSDPLTANDLAWYCACFREGAVDPARPLKLAEQAVATRPNDADFLNTLGAALYRAGRPAEAIAKLQAGIRLQQTEGTVADWLFLALAHQQLKRAEEAMKWLAKVQNWLDQLKAERPHGPKLPWHERLQWQILRAEAESLIGKVP